MTEQQLCDLVLEATGKSEKELPRARIIALSKLALQKLANVIAAMSGRPDAQAIRQLIRTDKEVTITSGVGSLTALKAEAEPILADEIYSSEVYFSGITRRGQPLPDRSAIELDRMKGFPYFTVSGDVVRVKNTDGSLASYSGTMTITGPVIRTLANVPSQLTEQFVAIIAFLATGGMEQIEKEAVTE